MLLQLHSHSGKEYKMRFWTIAPVVALCLSLATASSATPGQDIVTRSLQEQGFEVRLVHWTLLGRIRIIAVSDDIRREIVINPTTGEILRDYSQVIVVAEPDTDDDGGSTVMPPVAPSIPVSAEPPADVDASAMSALEGMNMGMAAPLGADPVRQ